jgi:KAP family P-loop domain
MWPDNETAIDFLNFSSVADTVAEIVVQAEGRPISIGVSGDWGVGKSSMIKLIRASLEQRDRQDASKGKYIYVEFNAWLYQGYDDVRAALLEIIANTLKAEAEKRQTAIGNPRLIKRFLNALAIRMAIARAQGHSQAHVVCIRRLSLTPLVGIDLSGPT